MRALSMTIAALAISGCLPTDPPEGVLACTSAAECPSGWSCRSDRCWRSPGADAGIDGDVVVDAGPNDAQVPGDTGIDAEPSDAGPVVGCNPLTHAECTADQRCAWVMTSDTAGETRCVADGTLGEGVACERGTVGDTGYDDCQRGLVCLANECRAVCDLADPASCGAGASCAEYSNLFAVGDMRVAGVCDPTCDPLGRTPELTCPSGQGCYERTGEAGMPSVFSCAPVTASAGAVGATPHLGAGGTPYLNGCVAGARPLSARDGTYYCAAYCQPVETHSGSTAGANGESPYRCQDLGGDATDACIFNWVFAGDVYDPVQNALGTCLPPDRTQLYDHDAEPTTPDVPFPSCTLLPNTDTDGNGLPQHLEVGCAPLPAP